MRCKVRLLMPLSSHIKPEPNPPLDRARVIRAREMYEEGFTVSRILAHCQMSLGTLYACLDGVPFGADGERMETIPRRRRVTGKRRRALAADDVSLVNRMLRTAERQVRDIETRLSAREQAPVERERDVRMLTGLTARAPRPAGFAQAGRRAACCGIRRSRQHRSGQCRRAPSRTLQQAESDGGRRARDQAGRQDISLACFSALRGCKLRAKTRHGRQAGQAAESAERQGETAPRRQAAGAGGEPRAEPCRGPHRRHRPDAGDVSRRAGPDHRRDRAADHRPRTSTTSRTCPGW